MAGDRARGTLERAAEQSARTMLAAVRRAIAKAKALVAEALADGAGALTEVGRGARGGVYEKLDTLFRARLAASLDGALRSLAEAMAEAGNAAANARAEAAGDGVSVRFSPEYLRDYLERITPKNAPSLAAVYTESMGAHAKEALRLAAVATFRDGAAAGLTLREQMKLLQENWALAARDDAPFRFVDRAGRKWENARYVQMLARTTAQRVRTAAYCDTLLRMNRPLVRVTNYANGRDCGVCAAWEGRLLDISSGRELRRFGIPSLDEARAAGVFHPNCVHNVLYVPIDEYPPAILKALGGRLSSGEPGAFGNPVKTNAGNETAASAKKRAAQAAQAAAERAKKEAEEAERKAAEKVAQTVLGALRNLGRRTRRITPMRSAAQDGIAAFAGILAENIEVVYMAVRAELSKDPIGKTGTWHLLGLSPGRELPSAPAEPKISVAEALARLERGETVTDPRGKVIRFGIEADKHIEKKRRPQNELEERLQSLDRAEATVRAPLEIWRDPRSQRDKYIRIIDDKETGQTAINVVTENESHSYSWHSNSVSLDHYRNGLLLYRAPDKTTGATDKP